MRCIQIWKHSVIHNSVLLDVTRFQIFGSIIPALESPCCCARLRYDDKVNAAGYTQSAAFVRVRIHAIRPIKKPQAFTPTVSNS
jgi:hypothetical protein